MSIWVCNYSSQCWLFTTHAIWNFVKSSRPFFLYRVYVSNTQCFKRYKTLLYIILVWDKKNLRLDRIIISTNSPFFISIFLYLHRFSFFLVFSLFSLFFTTVSNDRVIRRASELLLCIETSKEKCLWQSFFSDRCFDQPQKLKGVQ